MLILAGYAVFFLVFLLLLLVVVSAISRLISRMVRVIAESVSKAVSEAVTASVAATTTGVSEGLGKVVSDAVTGSVNGAVSVAVNGVVDGIKEVVLLTVKGDSTPPVQPTAEADTDLHRVPWETWQVGDGIDEFGADPTDGVFTGLPSTDSADRTVSVPPGYSPMADLTFDPRIGPLEASESAGFSPSDALDHGPVGGSLAGEDYPEIGVEGAPWAG